jgi:hypothetical protein
MGMLDDAIREHLELKRRRGADPTEVAREEREALDPSYAREEPASAGPVDGSTDFQPAAHAPPTEELVSADLGIATVADPDEPHATPGDGEETAEIDMQKVLDEDMHHADADAGADSPGAQWEVPGQERLSFE